MKCGKHGKERVKMRKGSQEGWKGALESDQEGRGSHSSYLGKKTPGRVQANRKAPSRPVAGQGENDTGVQGRGQAVRAAFNRQSDMSLPCQKGQAIYLTRDADEKEAALQGPGRGKSRAASVVGDTCGESGGDRVMSGEGELEGAGPQGGSGLSREGSRESQEGTV